VAIGMMVLLSLARPLRAGLSRARAEHNLEKRSGLVLQNAATAFNEIPSLLHQRRPRSTATVLQRSSRNSGQTHETAFQNPQQLAPPGTPAKPCQVL